MRALILGSRLRMSSSDNWPVFLRYSLRTRIFPRLSASERCSVLVLGDSKNRRFLVRIISPDCCTFLEKRRIRLSTDSVSRRLTSITERHLLIYRIIKFSPNYHRDLSKWQLGRTLRLVNLVIIRQSIVPIFQRPVNCNSFNFCSTVTHALFTRVNKKRPSAVAHQAPML